MLGYLRAPEHERTVAEYNRIRTALNGFRARMDMAASREARELIRLLNSQDSTVRDQLISLRADVVRFASAQRHERTFEEFSRINHALTELVSSLQGAAREEFFSTVRVLHRAFQDARPVPVQPVRDGRTEPVNRDVPTVRESQAPGEARERVQGQESANPIRAARDEPDRVNENDRPTVREVPEQRTARANFGLEDLAYDIPVGVQRRDRIEELEALLQRNDPHHRTLAQIAAARYAERLAEGRVDRPSESQTAEQRLTSRIGEIRNQRRAAAERSERLNRGRTARGGPRGVIPPGRGSYTRDMGVIGTPPTLLDEPRTRRANNKQQPSQTPRCFTTTNDR